jgi:hypothetical protein
MKIPARPTKNELNSIIKIIDDLDLTKASIDEIKDILIPLMTGYILSTPKYKPGLVLYRGTPYESKPDHKSFLSYPPKNIAKINRANREHEPMFYCSNSKNVPFFELGLKPSDRLVISKWETAKELLLNNIGYTKQNFKKLNSNRENLVFEVKDPHPEIYDKVNVLIKELLSNRFSQYISSENTDYYKLTIAIAEKHCIGDFINGLLYPTIPMNGNADNLAIKPSYIDNEGLLFKEVFYIEVKNISDSKIKYNKLDWANSISQNGLIEWKGHLPQWKITNDGGELEFKAEKGQWVARDKDGNIVEPN